MLFCTAEPPPPSLPETVLHLPTYIEGDNMTASCMFHVLSRTRRKGRRGRVFSSTRYVHAQNAPARCGLTLTHAHSSRIFLFVAVLSFGSQSRAPCCAREFCYKSEDVVKKSARAVWWHARCGEARQWLERRRESVRQESGWKAVRGRLGATRARVTACVRLERVLARDGQN